METNLVLFCRGFNERSETVQLTEENTFRCDDTEYLLYAGNILLRLQTDEAQCIHTVILTANREQIASLRGTAKTAFDVLAEPFSETPPTDFLAQIQTGDADVLQSDTKHFTYLLYRSPESVTVQQINRHLRVLPSLPELHSAGTPLVPTARVLRSH